MSADEKSLLSYLLTEEKKADSRRIKTSSELKQFSRDHRSEIQKYKRLTRNSWTMRYRAQQARRQVVDTFPVMQIVVPSSRSRRGTVAVVRRSPRLHADAREEGT
jgi:FtsZ-interacting cell division protein YlmF